MFRKIIGVGLTRTQEVPDTITPEALRDILNNGMCGLNKQWRLSSVSKKDGGGLALRYTKRMESVG